MKYQLGSIKHEEVNLVRLSELDGHGQPTDEHHEHLAYELSGKIAVDEFGRLIYDGDFEEPKPASRKGTPPKDKE